MYQIPKLSFSWGKEFLDIALGNHHASNFNCIEMMNSSTRNGPNLFNGCWTFSPFKIFPGFKIRLLVYSRQVKNGSLPLCGIFVPPWRLILVPRSDGWFYKTEFSHNPMSFAKKSCDSWRWLIVVGLGILYSQFRWFRLVAIGTKFW